MQLIFALTGQNALPCIKFVKMKIKFGQGVADGRGKLGGTVFSRNASGAYARNYVKPINPNTVAQQAVRSRFGNIASGFRTLTQAQRESFVNQAVNYPQQDKLGNTITLTGQQLYNKTNMQLSAIGAPDLVTVMPPPMENLPELTVNSSIEVGSLLSIFIDAVVLVNGEPTTVASNPAGYAAVVEATRPLSPGYDRLKDSDFKQIAVIPAGNLNWPASFNPQYAAVFGGLVNGSKIGTRVKLVSVANGQSTPWASANVDVVLE